MGEGGNDEGGDDMGREKGIMEEEGGGDDGRGRERERE